MKESSSLNSPTAPESRENPIKSLRLQLLSPQPSSVKAGMDQVRRWLQDHPEDQDVFQLLMEAAREVPTLRDEVRNLVQGFAEKDSAAANSILQEINALNQQPAGTEANLPEPAQENQTSPAAQDLLQQADDEYYAAQYDQAIGLYQRVLELDPNNLRARQQLEKAALNRMAGIPNPNLPREAVHAYRQARSYIAAEDYKTAVTFLNMAVEKAQEGGMKFPEAEAFLDITQNQILAVTYKKDASLAIHEERWEEALELLHKALKLDPTDEGAKKLREGLQGLLKAETLLDPYAIQMDSNERKNKVQVITNILRETDGIKELVSAKRYKALLARHSLYKAETDLPESWILKVLAPHNNIKNVQKSARNVLKADDPALKFIESQLSEQRPTRWAALIMLTLLFLIIGSLAWQSISRTFLTAPTPLPPLATGTATPTQTQTPTLTLTLTIRSTDTPTSTATPPSTVTATVSPTSSFTLGYVATFSGVSAVDRIDIPNGRIVIRLPKNQIIKILEKRTAFTIDYYLCEWKINEITGQGWIPVEYIKFGSPPSPLVGTPTP